MNEEADPGRRARPEGDEPSPRPGLRLWHTMVLILFLALLMRAVVELAPLLDVWSVILLMALAALALGVSAASALVARGSTRREGLLQLMAIAAEKGIPAGPAIEAYAGLCTGRYRRKLRAVAGNLEAGTALPDALDRVPGVLPPGAAGVIRVGWEVGASAPAAALRAAASAEAAWRPHRRAVLRPLMYGLALLLATPFALGVLLFKFPPIFRDFSGNFRRPVPTSVQLMCDLGDALDNSRSLGPAILLFELAILATLLALTAAYLGRGVSLFPFNRLGRRRHTAAILRALTLVVDGGKPMALGLDALARHYPRRWVRGRLGRAAGRARAGADWLGALRAEGLILAADAAVLESAQRAGNLGWALRELAEGNERRATYRIRAWSQALTPAVVLAGGAVVGLLGAAYFLPITALIRELAE